MSKEEFKQIKVVFQADFDPRTGKPIKKEFTYDDFRKLD